MGCKEKLVSNNLHKLTWAESEHEGQQVVLCRTNGGTSKVYFVCGGPGGCKQWES